MTARPPRRIGTVLAVYWRAAPLPALTRLSTVALIGLVPVVIAWLTKLLLDRLAGGPGPSAGLCAAALAGAGAVAAVAMHVSVYAEQEIGRRVALVTQDRLFAAVTEPDGIAQLEDPAFQDRLRLAQTTGQSGPQQLAGALLGIGQAALTAGGLLVALVAVSPLAAGLVLVSAVPGLLAQRRLGRRRTAMTVETTPNTRRQLFYSMLLLDVRAAKEIRLFGLGGFFRGRMLRELRTAQDGERRVDRTTVHLDGLLALLTAAVSGAALLVTVARIGSGAGTVGDVSVLVAALAGVQGTLATIVAQIAVSEQMLALFGHYVALVAPGSPGSPGPLGSPGPPGSPGTPPGPSARPRRCAPASSCATCGSATTPTTSGSSAAST